VAATIFYDQDADLSIIQGRKVAVLGYGSQGHAHALNLRDSGVDVRVGLRPGSASRAKAEQDGLRVLDTNDAAAEADVVVVLAPDTVQKQMWNDGLADHLPPARPWCSATGSTSTTAGSPPQTTSTCSWSPPSPPATSPAAPTPRARACPAWSPSTRTPPAPPCQLGVSYAAALGLTRAGVLQTTFAEETETDLFGEQAVLCGGVSHLVQAGFETLVEAGYQPEAAYFETLHELKLIVDMIFEGGLSWMRYSVSETAEYGDYVSGPRVINESLQAGHARHPHRDPGRHLRRQPRRRVGLRRPDLRRPPRRGQGPPDRTGRPQVRDMIPFIQTPTEGF
jgi:ketol-acid reductoisomerase